MERPNQITQKYNKSDLLMLEQSQTMLGNFIIDKAAFTALFTSFLDPYAANWQLAITAADALPSDENVMNDIHLFTQAVNEEMTVARNKYQALLTYIKMAYPNNDGVLQLFGQSQYLGARQNQTKMIELMELASAKANLVPYKAALIAKGFVLADINMLKTIELDLRTKNQVQEAAMSGRPLATQNRITAMNTVWDKMVLVNEAAQLVFQNDYAKLQQYLLYPETPAPPVPVPGALFTLITDQAVLSTVSIRIKGSSGLTSIDWGDGLVQDIPMDDTLQNMEHNYASANNYTIKIESDMPTAITQFFAMNCNVTAASVSAALTELDILDLLNNKLVAFTLPAALTKLRIIVFSGNQLDVTNVNTTLVTTNNYATSVLGSSISLQFGTNAAPTGVGLTAKAALESRGWGVNVN